MTGRLPRLADLPAPGARIHLLGAAGAGMRALAAALIEAGWVVSGSDRDVSALSETAAIGFLPVPDTDTRRAKDAALVIHSSAVPTDHPALVAARNAGTPVLKRAAALGALVNGRRLAAVAGTHGKTTVTTMLGLALEAADRDPLVLAGGHVRDWGGNARLGSGPEAVVEADEYDRSFLELDPSLAVVTSVEPDHLECYGSEPELRAAFEAFAGRATERLGVLVCADDAGARELGSALKGCRTYGLSHAADFRLEIVATASDGQRCRLVGPGLDLSFDLAAPGVHNAQNAAAALSAAILLGADEGSIAGSLSGFRGVDRRLQALASRDGLVIVDDYAHHPTEVRASIAALRSAWPGSRLVVVFQPHLFSRTRDMAEDFGRALSAADLALVLPIYPARERPIEGVDSSLIVRGAPGHVRTASLEQVSEAVAESSGDTVIAFMGAGDVTDAAHRAAREFTGDALGV